MHLAAVAHGLHALESFLLGLGPAFGRIDIVQADAEAALRGGDREVETNKTLCENIFGRINKFKS